MKKHGWILFGVTLVLVLFMVTANAHALEKETIQLSGLIEFGGAYENVNNKDGTHDEQSDLCLTTVELTAEVEVNDMVDVALTFLYEDPTFDGETSVDIDVATLTIENIGGSPLFLSAGAMYVPFGALLTHFPDDPLLGLPLTLSLGETREKAVIVGVEHKGFSLSGYAFNGDVNTAQDNHIEGYGFDANYAFDGEGLEILIGASYISNIADSDGLTGRLTELGVTAIKDYVGGFDAYLHVGHADFFFDVEYMTTLNRFEPGELATGPPPTKGAQPAVWNLEVGYNLDWGRNLEIALKYAGSSESDQLGFPEVRYGIALNQEIFEGVVASLGYLYDDYAKDDAGGRNDGSTVFGQMAIEF